MEIHCITNDIEIVHDRALLSESFRKFFENSSVALKLFTCIDLLSSEYLKSKYNLGNSRYLLVYFFHDLELEKFHFIGYPLQYSQTMSSFRHYWKALGHFEDEVNSLFGIKFYTNERIQDDFIPRISPSLMDKDFEQKSFSMDLSPNTDNIFKSDYDFQEFFLSEFGDFSEDVNFQMLTKGREIKSFKVALDSYRLFCEKKIEGLKFSEVFNFISHVNTKTPFAYQLLLCEFCDYLNGRNKNFYQNAQMMLLNELSLIFDHISTLVDCFKLFQEENVYKYLEELKKDIYTIFNKLNEFKPYPLITKAIINNFSPIWLRSIVDLTQKHSEKIERIKNSIISQPEYLRLAKVSSVKMHPLKAGFTGLALKSFGVSYDLRKNRPFYFYDQIDLKVPLGISGSSYDRMLIRLEDVLESMSNLVRLIEGFPVFEVQDKSSAKLMYSKQEEDIFFCFGQSGSGEIAYIISYNHELDKIERFHISTPSQRSLHSFEDLYQTTDFEKICTDWVSLGMSVSEVLK